MAGYPNEKRKTPGRFFWRLCLQTAGAIGVFFIVLTIAQSTAPNASQWKVAMYQCFTEPMDVKTMVSRLQYGYEVADAEAVQASASPYYGFDADRMVIPVSGTVVPHGTTADSLQIVTAEHERVLSAYAGTVTDCYEEAGRAVLVISHANGFVTTYGGCQECYVTVNMPVQKGQLIAKTGADGKFYFSASYLGHTVNLLEFIQNQSQNL